VGATAVFGEWCVRKGVAISALPTMFVIFGVKVQFRYEEKADKWLDIFKFSELKDEDARLFNIYESW